MVIKMDSEKLSSQVSKKIPSRLEPHLRSIYLADFKIEYEEVGYWRGLWLKITRQKPPIKYPPLPESKGDTITIRRPTPYEPSKVKPIDEIPKD